MSLTIEQLIARDIPNASKLMAALSAAGKFTGLLDFYEWHSPASGWPAAELARTKEELEIALGLIPKLRAEVDAIKAETMGYNERCENLRGQIATVPEAPQELRQTQAAVAVMKAAVATLRAEHLQVDSKTIRLAGLARAQGRLSLPAYFNELQPDQKCEAIGLALGEESK